VAYGVHHEKRTPIWNLMNKRSIRMDALKEALNHIRIYCHTCSNEKNCYGEHGFNDQMNCLIRQTREYAFFKEPLQVLDEYEQEGRVL
jgi:hypothetical protein